METSRIRWKVRIVAAVVFLAAVGTAELGRTALGFLVPAAALFVQGLCLWFGRWRRVLIAFLVLAIASEIAMDLVLAFGEGLGRRKLDISGVAFLLNLLAGGPVATALSVPVLAGLRFDTFLRIWFDAHERSHA